MLNPSRRHWCPIAARSGARGSCSGYDLRGHGGSAAPRGDDWSIEGYGADIIAVLDARGVERAVFVGNSLGAFASIAAAHMAPDRCAGLFLVDPGGDPSRYERDGIAQMLAAFEADFDQVARVRRAELLEGARPETRALVLPTLEGNPPSMTLPTLRRLFEFRAADVLRAWSGPTFILAGPMGSGELALQNLLGLPHRELRGVSHFVQLDAPEVFHEELDRFLAAL